MGHRDVGLSSPGLMYLPVIHTVIVLPADRVLKTKGPDVVA